MEGGDYIAETKTDFERSPDDGGYSPESHG